ncbi:uncharacterized protein BHQ10_004011 [Talaromyces amestolkiae]|uniref:Uncharacterized protein n=1 Tax=Talaromyces amestolkiae TaxID=1196081 RepID=A0A364KWU3_TALAM|nr:uncharacterized protein BHQ10_004011 [Talaromyces amestolkiae]RAO67999.1 hypothetical protein BHQ10_004011 [Talaromyces amestolkiae]
MWSFAAVAATSRRQTSPARQSAAGHMTSPGTIYLGRSLTTTNYRLDKKQQFNNQHGVDAVLADSAPQSNDCHPQTHNQSPTTCPRTTILNNPTYHHHLSNPLILIANPLQTLYKYIRKAVNPKILFHPLYTRNIQPSPPRLPQRTTSAPRPLTRPRQSA